jgi:hypothetical protein
VQRVTLGKEGSGQHGVPEEQGLVDASTRHEVQRPAVPLIRAAHALRHCCDLSAHAGSLLRQSASHRGSGAGTALPTCPLQASLHSAVELNDGDGQHGMPVAQGDFSPSTMQPAQMPVSPATRALHTALQSLAFVEHAGSVV